MSRPSYDRIDDRPRGLRQSLKSYVLLLTYVLVLANRRSLLGDAANGGPTPLTAVPAGLGRQLRGVGICADRGGLEVPFAGDNDRA
jgi:hypothetical protein